MHAAIKTVQIFFDYPFDVRERALKNMNPFDLIPLYFGLCDLIEDWDIPFNIRKNALALAGDILWVSIGDGLV